MMDKVRLGEAFTAKIVAFMGDDAPNIDDRASLLEVMTDFAEEIIEEITDNAEVDTTVTGTLPDGVENASGEGGVS